MEMKRKRQRSQKGRENDELKEVELKNISKFACMLTVTIICQMRLYVKNAIYSMVYSGNNEV